MTGLALHHLTALDASPLELVDIAADTGCHGICIFTHSPVAGASYPLLAPEDAAPMQRRLAARGVRVTNIEFFWVLPELDLEPLKPAMALGAGLGAKRIVVHIHDPEYARALESFGALCQLAAAYGLGVGLEFMAFAPGCCSLGQAARFVREMARPDVGIGVDCLHLMRTGGTVAELAGIERGAFSYGQLCDGPLEMPREAWIAEAIQDRAVPGTGAFPLGAILATLPRDLPLDVEVPLHRLRDRGISPLERARLAVAGARDVLAQPGIE